MEGLPASSRFDLVGAGKAVTAVEADANGARLVCGSHDYKCYLYDFGGLKADGKSFRSWEVRLGLGRVIGCPSPPLPACRARCFVRCACLLTISSPSVAGALQVTEGYPVVAVSWSPTGDAFMVVTSYSQASDRASSVKDAVGRFHRPRCTTGLPLWRLKGRPSHDARSPRCTTATARSWGSCPKATCTSAT